MNTNKSFNYLKVNFGDTPTYTFVMKVSDLVSIYYVAVRGTDNEEGAVQRVLNKKRISDIKEFILKGHTFFNSFILNWTNSDFEPIIEEEEITLQIKPSSAQVIDGQHRIAGFEAAMQEDDSVSNRDVIVTLCLNLTTKKAAEIFLNINTEQKPVPKSLIYDLFGELGDDENHAVNRAADIARCLNDDKSSPLYNYIKFPGTPRGVGSLELSTIVSALKEHIKSDGVFNKFKLNHLNHQKTVIMNFFTSIRYYYDKAGLWDKKNKNPFLKAAGFNGAIDFLTSSLIEKCAAKGNFSIEEMKSIISMDHESLITLDDIRGLDGKTSRKKIKDCLQDNLVKSMLPKNEYTF